jgi:hypothetical protein
MLRNLVGSLTAFVLVVSWATFCEARGPSGPTKLKGGPSRTVTTSVYTADLSVPSNSHHASLPGPPQATGVAEYTVVTVVTQVLWFTHTTTSSSLSINLSNVPPVDHNTVNFDLNGGRIIGSATVAHGSASFNISSNRGHVPNITEGDSLGVEGRILTLPWDKLEGTFGPAETTVTTSGH